MRICILGGTGSMGRGLALRWVTKHDIVLGSRKQEKAGRIANEVRNIARGFYLNEMKGSVLGMTNQNAVGDSDIVILAIPPGAVIPVMKDLKPYFKEGQIVVSTVVPMRRGKKLFYFESLEPDREGESRSAAEVVAEIVDPIPVVSAFQTVPAAFLNNIDAILNIDVFLCGNDETSIVIVSRLVRDIANLRPLKAGPLQNSKWVESFTPLLLNAAVLNGLKDPSVRIVPWFPSND
jgi:NADPH-dependent F420 reductase